MFFAAVNHNHDHKWRTLKQRNTIRIEIIACVASVSVRFRSKERGTRVKDRAKNGASKRAGRVFFGSCFISRAAKTENPVPRSFFSPKPNGKACYAGYEIHKSQTMTFWTREAKFCFLRGPLWGSSLTGNVQWSYFRADSGPAGCERFGHIKAGLQVDKHSARVRNYPQRRAGQGGNQCLLQR